jgi:hypothetical protein
MGERVNLSDGDVSVKLKQVADKRGSSLVPGLNLNAITYINGSANFTAPMNYTQSYELEFEVSQNGNSDKGNYEVAQVCTSFVMLLSQKLKMVNTMLRLRPIEILLVKQKVLWPLVRESHIP